MLKLLRIMYSSWVVITFMLMTIPILFFYLFVKLIPYRRQINGVYFINRWFVTVWSKIIGFRYKVNGLSNIDRQQTYVVVMNHVNAADIIATAYGLRVSAKPLIKKELLFIPVLG